MMIDVDKMNLDLKEGRAFYSTRFDVLDAEQLAKAYAYALQTWGDGVQSRTVLDSVRDRDGRYDKAMKLQNDERAYGRSYNHATCSSE